MIFYFVCPVPIAVSSAPLREAEQAAPSRSQLRRVYFALAYADFPAKIFYS